MIYSLCNLGTNLYFLREHFYEHKGQVYITKLVGEDFDPADFIEKVLKCFKAQVFVASDFHGFCSDREDQCFVFASRNTSNARNSNRSGWICRHEEDRQALIDYYGQMATNDLLQNWFAQHDLCQGLASSDFQAVKLIAMKIIVMPLDLGIAKEYIE